MKMVNKYLTKKIKEEQSKLNYWVHQKKKIELLGENTKERQTWVVQARSHGLSPVVSKAVQTLLLLAVTC